MVTDDDGRTVEVHPETQMVRSIVDWVTAGLTAPGVRARFGSTAPAALTTSPVRAGRAWAVGCDFLTGRRTAFLGGLANGAAAVGEEVAVACAGAVRAGLVRAATWWVLGAGAVDPLTMKAARAAASATNDMARLRR
ncbi:MAG: hypothetical protein ACXVWU_04140 [Nocardioides sp.]